MSNDLLTVTEFLRQAPLAAWLGMKVMDRADLSFRLTFNETHIGNPAIRALHGGVIAAFLELAMQAELHRRTGKSVSTANISIEYLSSSRPEDMVGTVKILREGRRIAFVEASGWQAEETRLVAVARACFTLS